MVNNEGLTREQIAQELKSLLAVASAVDTDDTEAVANLPHVCKMAYRRAEEVYAWFLNDEITFK